MGVAAAPNGDVAVSGQSFRVGGPLDFYTAKYAAADGALLWDKRFSAPVGSAYGTAVAMDAGGNVIATGSMFRPERDFYTIKYAAADGAVLWTRQYSSPDNRDDEPVAVATDAGGNVLVTGRLGGFYVGSPSRFYTAKYAAADGALLWEKSFSGP